MNTGISDPQRFADAARNLIGTQFKLHGRDPEIGLDCVGLIGASLKAIGRQADLPSGYAFRNSSISEWIDCAATSGLEPTIGAVKTGDVLLMTPGPAQHHLAIALSADTIVHAHAALRRIVVQPLAPGTKLVAHWRLQTLP